MITKLILESLILSQIFIGALSNEAAKPSRIRRNIDFDSLKTIDENPKDYSTISTSSDVEILFSTTDNTGLRAKRQDDSGNNENGNDNDESNLGNSGITYSTALTIDEDSPGDDGTTTESQTFPTTLITRRTTRKRVVLMNFTSQSTTKFGALSTRPSLLPTRQSVVTARPNVLTTMSGLVSNRSFVVTARIGEATPKPLSFGPIGTTLRAFIQTTRSQVKTTTRIGFPDGPGVETGVGVSMPNFAVASQPTSTRASTRASTRRRVVNDFRTANYQMSSINFPK